MSSSSKIKPLLMVLIFVIIAAFLNKYLKQEDYTHYTAAKGEARFNHLYAAQLLSGRYGIDTTTLADVSNQSFLNSDTAFVLLISNTRIYQQPVLLNAISQWVREGGILILSAKFYSNTSLDEYFPGLGVLSERVKLSEADDHAIEFNKQYEIDISHHSILKTESEPLWAVSDAHGQHIVALPYEKGELILVNDFRPFNNTGIAKYDHAAFFLWMIKNTEINRLFHLLYPDTPGIFSLLIGYPLQLILFFLTIFFFLWKIWGYFGPVRHELLSDKQMFKEHLSFSGQFLWRNVQTEELYRLLYAEAEHRILQLVPDWFDRTDEEKVTILADLTAEKESDIKSTIFYKADKDKLRFLSFVRNIIKIRNSI